LTRIVDDNKSMLVRLQSAKSHYEKGTMEDTFQKQRELGQRIQSNANRFNKNPYFLHSVCTPNDLPFNRV
jgi:hypothetical protein